MRDELKGKLVVFMSRTHEAIICLWWKNSDGSATFTFISNHVTMNTERIDSFMMFQHMYLTYIHSQCLLPCFTTCDQIKCACCDKCLLLYMRGSRSQTQFYWYLPALWNSMHHTRMKIKRSKPQITELPECIQSGKTYLIEHPHFS